MKIIRILLFLILLVSIATFGCSKNSDVTNAEKVASNLFEAIKNKDFDTAVTFYSPEFFELNPNVNWLEVLINKTNKLGDLSTYELKGWSVTNAFGTLESGTYVELKYSVTYSRYPATETLTLLKSSTGSEFSIVAHSINSIGLLIE